MRIGWRIPLPGPFSVGGTVWRSKPRRRRGYHGTLPGWKCPHNHSRPDLAEACAQREARRRRVTQAAPSRPDAQVQRCAAAVEAASDETHAMLTAYRAEDLVAAQSRFAAAREAVIPALTETRTLIRTDPGNPAIPELTKALETIVGILDELTEDAPGQETAQ
jgi:hypothetical protein